jgi:phage terminase large subunit GpA-like protein
MRSALDQVESRTVRRFAPPSRMTISAWADKERTLSPEASAEPGRWRTSRVPYLRQPMDVIADRHTETVVVMASSQVGKSELLLNVLGYHMHLDQAPILMVQPTIEMASAMSKDRIAPMLRDTPALRGLVAAARAKDSSNTTLHKSYPGGALTLAGANSPASLASRPIRVLLGDELDRWPVSIGTEGDPLLLALKRTTTFRRRKAVLVSSPTIKGASRIEDWWQISDQRRYHTPCLKCGAMFVLEWSHVRWDEGEPTTAHIECPHCLGRIEDHERLAMIAAGSWIASAPFTGIAGFHIWEIFSPWRSLADQVQAFLVARRSLEMRQVWANTSLGQVWEPPSEKVDPSSLLLRREAYAAELPAGVGVLTMGVDTQDDRLEALIVGWGPGEECWIVSRETLTGDPARPEVWKDLDAVLSTDWQHELGGTLRIQCSLIDAGGHRTQAVYSNVIPRQHRRLYASFGRSGGERAAQGLLVSAAKPIRPANGTGNVLRRIVDSDQCKALIYSRLKIGEPGPEYLHLPMSLDSTFADELCSEQLITKRSKFGVPTKSWVQIRERNESLDCLVLALAALRIVAPTPARFQKLAGELEGLRLGNAAVRPPRRESWIPRRPR